MQLSDKLNEQDKNTARKILNSNLNLAKLPVSIHFCVEFFKNYRQIKIRTKRVLLPFRIKIARTKFFPKFPLLLKSALVTF